MNDIEIWKNIENYEGIYQVSNKGRVKSLNYLRTGKERILKSAPYDKYGHQQVQLCKNCVRTFKTVHRLVAEAFIPNPDNKPCIDHINCDPTNNYVENLRWCTTKENCNNPLTIINKRDAARTKMTPVYCFETDTIYESASEAERELNVQQSGVSMCCRGIISQTGGYHFCYASDIPDMQPLFQSKHQHNI